MYACPWNIGKSFTTHKFVCLFVCMGFIAPLENFHSYWDVTITGEGLQILTYAQRSWTLRSERSSACHTYCGTGYPFIMIIYEDPWHLHLLPSFKQWGCHYLFLRHRSVAAGNRTPNPVSYTHLTLPTICSV